MPSVRSLLAGICLTTYSLLSSTNATPIPQDPNCERGIPVLPVNGGARELSAPTLTLAYIVIGRGVQNYTCTAAGAAPVAIGAVANLYDATPLGRLSTTALAALAPKAAYVPTPKKGSPLLGLPYIGLHYFDSAGVPVFSLEADKAKTAAGKPIVYVKKTDNIPAPANADKGPAKTGAVDWLLLDQKLDLGYDVRSVGLKQVYRVVTAGGVGGTCEVAGVKSVQYATEYWLYK